MTRATILALLLCSPTLSQHATHARLRVTYYCTRGITASGCGTAPGQCAAPAWIPLGSRVKVDGRWLVVTDRTARKWRNGTIDVWVPTRREALVRGVHYSWVEVVAPAKAWRYNRRAARDVGASRRPLTRRPAKEVHHVHLP